MKYNVHLYREMKLFYPDVEADSPQDAARKAQEFLTEDAQAIEDCQGENFSVLIDVVGDTEFSQSTLIDFQAMERMMK